jgi:uncharacterized small protein (DUF1192 family)
VTTFAPGAVCGKISAMSMDDDIPKKRPGHEIGQDLALLSIDELTDRIAVLKAEIARIEAALVAKRASRSSADQFFKR